MEKQASTQVSCSDGDCIFQLGETCHSKKIRIDDNNKCISKDTE
jgi:hypothetical protein